jgi:Leucine-rich repeat (LRR) protein
MSLNQLDDIVDSIKHLSLLRYLKMSFNRIEYINKSGVTRLIELRYFDLIENLISSFEIGSLHTFYRLESILLMNNNIGRLQSFTFYNSSTLRYINIENNMIEFVDEFAFFYLESLTLISLRNNRIKHIFNHAFDSIQGGTFSLNLNQNLNIQNISLSSMSSDLKCLYLSYESLSHLKDYTDDFFPFKVLDLSKSKMSTLYARTIKGMFLTLILSENKLFSFEDNSFTYLPNLVEIDFTKNLIKSLDFHEAFAFSQLNMTRLVFNSNRIEHISPEFFLKFPALSHLDLSNNNFYSLTKRDFLNLFHLECLILNSNQILSIEKKTFTYLPSFRRLELKNNLIYDLLFLANLKSLNELVLSGNQIEKFEYPPANLSLLDLSQNRLSSFETVDSIAKNLKTLILNSNQIKKIDLFNFDRLEYLDMSYNGLTMVNFSSKNIISHLNLNGNQMENMNMNSLKYVKNLSPSNTSAVLVLNLDLAFSPNLEELDVSLNNLSAVDKNYFLNLKSLRRLNLSQTLVGDYEFLTRLDLSLLEEIDLSYNQQSNDLKFSFLLQCQSLKKLIIKEKYLVACTEYLFFSYTY